MWPAKIPISIPNHLQIPVLVGKINKITAFLLAKKNMISRLSPHKKQLQAPAPCSSAGAPWSQPPSMFPNMKKLSKKKSMFTEFTRSRRSQVIPEVSPRIMATFQQLEATKHGLAFLASPRSTCHRPGRSTSGPTTVPVWRMATLPGTQVTMGFSTKMLQWLGWSWMIHVATPSLGNPPTMDPRCAANQPQQHAKTGFGQSDSKLKSEVVSKVWADSKWVTKIFHTLGTG